MNVFLFSLYLFNSIVTNFEKHYQITLLKVFWSSNFQ